MQSSQAVLPVYDFSDALALSVQARLNHCVEELRWQANIWQQRWVDDVPPVPPSGALSEKLNHLEQQNETVLPAEYRDFLRLCRYVDLGNGIKIGGISHEDVNGVSDCNEPWLSDDHSANSAYWVIGDCWRYADGDQLLISVHSPIVALYLHEYGPLIEPFAPSFSLALWRIIHERP
jgi:hypothetical protein